MSSTTETPEFVAVEHAVTRMRDQQLSEACRAARIGQRAVQSRERTADTARRRAVVAWILHYAAEWRQQQIATALGLSLRQVKRIMAQQYGRSHNTH